MQRIKNTIAFIKTRMTYIITASLLFSNMLPIVAYADVDLTKTVLFTGTIDLLNAAGKALLGCVVGLTAVLSIVKGIAWQTADEQEKPMRKKAFISTIALGILIACIVGVVTAVLGAYGVKDNSGFKVTLEIYQSVMNI